MKLNQKSIEMCQAISGVIALGVKKESPDSCLTKMKLYEGWPGMDHLRRIMKKYRVGFEIIISPGIVNFRWKWNRPIREYLSEFVRSAVSVCIGVDWGHRYCPEPEVLKKFTDHLTDKMGIKAADAKKIVTGGTTKFTSYIAAIEALGFELKAVKFER